ncbi:MAG: Low affinity potassium transport system protein kup [Frankiales bacterium]|nr:Low affinity potassium transport system protein kup [Frankiales bacterium]
MTNSALTEPEASSRAPRRAHPAVHGAGAAGLALGALGVVYGDIGTSPLYALQTVFAIDNRAVKATPGDVYGVISLVFWSITIVVSIKYVIFILRADNDGEGGVMALAALIRGALGSNARRTALLMGLGVFGASLFYGDSVITPSISVLSAVEGLKIAAPSLDHAVLPIGIAILAVLFAVQRWGTHQVGRFFGPVMVLWFAVLALLGIPQIARHPDILKALSPTYVVSFIADHPYTAFIAMGAVVLAITGAEALYADMGHFGRPPIRRAWFAVVFPALVINYLGQGALILHRPSATENPFFLLVPNWARIPMVVLATLATVIASQAVISGAFSVSRQAVRLGFLPHLTIRHTSTRESGQIYVPAVNWLLFIAVLVVTLTFRSSNRLATAYGVAVTGTLIITTILFLVVARSIWHWARWQLILTAVVFGGLEVTYFAANLTKVAHGGWLPLLIAAAVFTVMMTWQRGRLIVTARRIELEGPLTGFVEQMYKKKITRVPGTAVFPHPTKDTTPLALRANVEHNHVLHEQVVIISAQAENVPHVPLADAVTIDHLGHSDDGIVHLMVRFGFQDDQNIPEVLRSVRRRNRGRPELDIDPDTATYFLSKISIRRGKNSSLTIWRKRLFIGLAHNAANPAEYFGLPDDRTVVMGSHVDL